jgi:hypothetical protein
VRYFSQGRFRQQVRFLQQQFLQEGNLPFSDILSTGLIEQALTALQVGLVDCVYTPLVTLCVFLGQVLSADHSCRAAVARLIAYRVARKERACSAETSAYCQARKRLPEQFFSQIARRTGRQLDANAKSGWLWKNRRVYIFDGATVSMPDTYENQKAYPQPPQQKPGLGFPLMRIAAIFSLACGAVLDVGTCRYAGKGQSELGSAAPIVVNLSARRHYAGRSPDVRLDRTGDAQAARRRQRLSIHLTPPGRFSSRQAFGKRRSHRDLAQADQAALH